MCWNLLVDECICTYTDTHAHVFQHRTYSHSCRAQCARKIVGYSLTSILYFPLRHHRKFSKIHAYKRDSVITYFRCEQRLRKASCVEEVGMRQEEFIETLVIYREYCFIV